MRPKLTLSLFFLTLLATLAYTTPLCAQGVNQLLDTATKLTQGTISVPTAPNTARG